MYSTTASTTLGNGELENEKQLVLDKRKYFDDFIKKPIKHLPNEIAFRKILEKLFDMVYHRCASQQDLDDSEFTKRFISSQSSDSDIVELGMFMANHKKENSVIIAFHMTRDLTWDNWKQLMAISILLITYREQIKVARVEGFHDENNKFIVSHWYPVIKLSSESDWNTRKNSEINNLIDAYKTLYNPTTMSWTEEDQRKLDFFLSIEITNNS